MLKDGDFGSVAVCLLIGWCASPVAFQGTEELEVKIMVQARPGQDIRYNKLFMTQVHVCQDCTISMHFNNRKYLGFVWSFSKFTAVEKGSQEL